MAENDANGTPDVTKNSNMSFGRGEVCLRMMTPPVLSNPTDQKQIGLRKMLDRSIERLWKLRPLHALCEKEKVLDYVLQQVFFQPEGLPHTVYLVDLTIESKDSGERRKVGIRPQVLPNSFIYRVLGPGRTLRFDGVPRGREFQIGSIRIVQDGGQLPYEASAEIIPYRDKSKVQGNFLDGILDKTVSLVRHTEQKLRTWEEYLDWKQELSGKGLVGCRYFAAEPGQAQQDRKRPGLIFGLIFELEEDFELIRRELRSGMEVYGRDYSKDKWRFVYEYDPKARFQSWRLGSFRGVESAGFSDRKELEKRYKVLKDCPFEKPYIVWARYDISEEDSESLDHSRMSPSEFMKSVLLKRLPADGFLALSFVQDFALIKRFRIAIRNLRDGDCDSPNLPLWLFDATQARLPRPEDFPEITNWLDPWISQNKDQCDAVRKMLAAPDLCLVQGPPGTGKTTVIAEAIYQFVRQGKRVLLASQSNDAVDNALERLQKDPVIRAVRMSNSERLRREGGSGYLKDTVLTEFYQSLAVKTEKSWLEPWQERDEAIRNSRKDYRDAMNYEEDLRALAESAGRAGKDLHDNELEIQDLRAQIKEAEEGNQALRAAGQQFDFLARDIEKGQDDDFLILSKGLLQSMVPLAQKLSVLLHAGGLFPDLPDFGSDDIEQAICGKLSLLLRCCHQLPALIEKTRQASGSGTVDSIELKKIQLQLEENDREMDELPDDDDEGFRRLRKQAKELKRRRDELQRQSGNISDSLSEAERSMLSPVLLQALADDGGRERLQAVLQKGKEESDSIWPQIAAAGREWLSSQSAADLSELSGRVMTAENHRKTLLENMESLRRQQQEKQNTLAVLRERYGSEDSSQASVAQSIRALLDQQEKEQSEDAFRAAWEPVLKEYRERLTYTSAGADDSEMYQRTYLDACNVVGTSCTANMREFEEHGFEDFDVAIIDEVSKATPPELLLPLMRAHKAVLVGDHRQLPPMFGENENSYEALMNRTGSGEDDEDDGTEVGAEERNSAQASLLTPENFQKYKDMVTASLFREFFETADDSIKQRLGVQFRMHREIMQVINRFYENRLRAGLTEEQERTMRDHGLTLLDQHHRPFITPEHHAYWLDSGRLPDGTPVYEGRRGSSTSAINPLEQQMILRLVQLIGRECAEKKQRKTIGIISFYQAQIGDLRKRIDQMAEKKELDLSYLELQRSDINTVDRFQGKEKNIIIVSMVRSKKSHRLGQHTLAFERINVAFSRAQQLLLIVGSQDLFADQKVTMPAMDKKGTLTTNVYGNILQYLRGIGTALDSGCVLTADDCEEVRRQAESLAAERKSGEGSRR